MSSESIIQVPLIWSRAVKRYEEITHKPLTDPSIANLTTVQSLTTLLESENNAFIDFRAKRHAIFGAMATAMRPVELLMDFASESASTAFPPSALVFGAVRHLMSAAKGVSEKYDAIIRLMEWLKDFTVRLETYTRQSISERLSDKLSEMVIALIEVLAIARGAIRHGRAWAIGKSIIGGGKDAEEAVEKLRRLVEGEKGLVGAETLTEVKGISAGVSALSKQIEALSLAHNTAKKEAQDTETSGHSDKVKAILRPTMTSEDVYWAVNRSRVAGTGNWIREELLFNAWLNNDRPVLWISGNPGSGKSYIAANLINFLYEQYPQKVQHSSHVSVAYFYFKEDDHRTRSFHQALKDMAYMISQNDQIYAKFLTSRLESEDNISTTTSAWKNLFSDFFIRQNGDSRVVILLDGIDEAFRADREEFFDLARDIENGGRIRLAMLGRPQILDEIMLAMEMPTVPTISITPKSNVTDIARYININISKSASLRRVSKAKREELAEKIRAKAEGMFIWVDLMMKNILKRTGITSWNAILNALDKAPREINTMIQHVLEGYSATFEDDHDAAANVNELFAWVSCAESPLKLSELRAVLDWVSGPDSELIWLERTLRIQLASILVLTREDGLTTTDLQETDALSEEIPANESDLRAETDDDDNLTEFDSNPATTQVTFSHASIGDFFRDETRGKITNGNNCPAVGVNLREAQVHCLRVCLDVLCRKAYPEEGAEAPAPLLQHARTSWLQYLTSVDISKTSREDKEQIGLCLAKLLLQDPRPCDFITYLPPLKTITVELAKLFNKWLGDPDVTASLPGDLRADYLGQVKDNSFDIFLRSIKYISTLWLFDLFGNPVSYCWYIAMFRDCRYGIATGSSLTADLVIQTAEWCGLERTATWHRRLAMTLRELGQHSQALEYFKRAIEIDPPMWIARHGIAWVYKAMGKTKTLIKYDKKFLAELGAALPEKAHSSDFHIVHERLAAAYGSFNKLDRALAHYRSGFDHAPRCYNCLGGVIGILRVQQRYQEIIDVFRSLDTDMAHPVPGKSYSRLVEVLCLPDFVDSIHRIGFTVAAERTGETSFIIDAHRRALNAARRDHHSIVATGIELALAQLLTRSGDVHEGAKLLGKLLTVYRGTLAEKKVEAMLSAAGTDLANYYLLQSMEAGAASPEAARYGAEIERIAASAGIQLGPNSLTRGSGFGPDDKADQYPVGYSHFAPNSIGMILGQYYRLIGRKEEARACFRERMREGVRQLTDDDPLNDVYAWLLVGKVLAAVSDDEKAVATFGRVIMMVGWDEDGIPSGEEGQRSPEQRVEGVVEETVGGGENAAEAPTLSVDDKEAKKAKGEGDAESESEEEGNDKNEGKLQYLRKNIACDGCQGVFLSLIGLHICRFCDDVGVCEVCHAKLKAGTLPATVCSATHDWVRIPSLNRKTRTPPTENMMWSGGKWIDIKAWTDSLKKEWDL